MPFYEDLMRAMLWPNAVATSPLVPHSSPSMQQLLPTVCEGPEGFRVCIDVHQFQPREITLKTQGRDLIIEAHHQDRPDEHGYVARHFVRRYVLPEDYDIDHVTSWLSSDAVLTIIAPKVQRDESGTKTKTVPIVLSNAPAVPQQHIFPDVKAGVPAHSAKPASHHVGTTNLALSSIG